jgi:hypothetical protein
MGEEKRSEMKSDEGITEEQTIEHNRASEQTNTRKQSKRILILKWTLFSIWALVFIASLIGLSQDPKIESADLKEIQELKIYNFDKDRYAKWNRADAIEFGISQLANTINYLFLAAAAILGFVAKIMIDPMVEPKDKRLFHPKISILLMHAAIGCFLSLFYGLYAYLYLPEIADQEGFSIYENVGISAFFQVISLFLAALFLIYALLSAVNRQITTKP